jgi:hypothetical protein
MCDSSIGLDSIITLNRPIYNRFTLIVGQYPINWLNNIVKHINIC